ncbi:metallophosphoesterase family protein [Chloroflexota bacterium]
MLIGLLTDTHIPWERKELPAQVTETFRDVDLILHAGDIYAHSVLDALEQIAPVLAARGDDDYDTGTDSRVQEKHILQLEGLNLWLIHEGPIIPLSSAQFSLWWQNRISPEDDKYGKPDIIICGHEHRSLVERFDGLLYVNSGSPTYLNYQRGLGTVGLLKLDSGKADVQIIQL